MVSKKVILENETGLHARPASELAKIAMNYKSNIDLKIGENVYNAKSILNIMSAGIKSKTEIEVICNGVDEEEALNKIIEGFNNNFGE